MASMVEIGLLAFDAGVRSPLTLSDAIAIAVAESNGDPAKLGDRSLETEKWGPSVGLWQIRSLKAEKGKGTTRDADRLTDPAFNAKAMAEISGNGKNWSPWSVMHPTTDPAGFARYTAAKLIAVNAANTVIAYRGVNKAADAVADATGLSDLGKIGAVIQDAAETPVRAMRWFMETGTQKRLAFGMVGMVALLAGAYLIAKPVIDPMVDQGAKIAGKVAKAAAV